MLFIFEIIKRIKYIIVTKNSVNVLRLFLMSLVELRHLILSFLTFKVSTKITW